LAKAPRIEGLDADMPLKTAARVLLRAHLKAVLSPAPDVLRGDDTKAVHDMRVAIRRLRSAMATFADCFPKRRWRMLRRKTRRIGSKLGEVRDADVHLGALRGTLGGATAADRPGIAHAIELLGARRRRSLAEFAIELSQFDRELFARTVADD